MTVGAKIKLARILRGKTQRELGLLIGLPDVRIRQYEIDARTPKEEVIQDISSALGVPIKFFINHSIDSCDDIMQLLFELENSEFGACVVEHSNSPGEYAIVFKDPGLNDMLGLWYKRREMMEKSTGVNSVEDYELWKACFPINHEE